MGTPSKRAFVPERVMAMLLRCAFAFLIAFSVQNPERAATYFETLGLKAAKAQIEADHPSAKLRQSISAWLEKRTAPISN